MASLKQFALSAAVLLGVVGQAMANPLEPAAEPAEMAARSEGDLFSADSGLMVMKRDELLNSVVDGLVARFAEDEEVQLALRGKSKKSKSCSAIKKELKKVKKQNRKLLGKKAKKSKSKKGSKKDKKDKKKKSKKAKKAGKKSSKKAHKKDDKKKDKKNKKDKKKDEDDE